MDGSLAPMKVSQVILLPLFLQLRQVTGQQLSPPYYNLAQGKPVYASSTCGEDVYERELFCEMTGAHPNAIPDESHFVIRGQVCDYCDPAYPPNSHPEQRNGGRVLHYQEGLNTMKSILQYLLDK